MITKRIIPCLDVRNGRVVKGTNFEGIKDVADPVEMARMYNAAGADELVFYDITASAEGRAPSRWAAASTRWTISTGCSSVVPIKSASTRAH
mgnify:CR=1 FL=1